MSIENNLHKRKGFTLIELLGTIAIIAVIAVITVPIVLNVIDNSKEETFKIGVFSVYDAYRHEESKQNYDELGRVDISLISSNLNNERYQIGKIERNQDKKIEVRNLSDGNFCANGTEDDLTIVKGDCSNLDETAPIINNIAVEKTTSSMNIIVSFSEPDSLIKRSDFRLLDSEGNVIKDWENSDTLTGIGDTRVTTKKYDNLVQDTTYIVEVKIVNSSGKDNDTVIGEKTVTLNRINIPTFSYDITKYEYNKIVTINYDENTDLINKYMVIDSSDNIIVDWTIVDGNSKTILIDQYDCTVIATSFDGTTTLPSSSAIGYIDYTKPSVYVSDINNEWSKEDEITLNITDNLSGVNKWCITNTNNVETCEWNNIETSVNTSVKYTIRTNGEYYIFVHDIVENISDVYGFTIDRVDSSIPNSPTIEASDSIASGEWHDTDYTLTFSGSSSISRVVYKYVTSANMNDEIVATSVEIGTNTVGTTYYVKACNVVGTCSENTTYIAKLDKLTPSQPIITATDSVVSNNWHTSNFTLNFSGSTTTSPITYYYGTNENSLVLTGTKLNITNETASETYYVKACNALNKCSTLGTYVVKLDKTAPIDVYATLVATTTKSLTVRASGVDNISGIAKYEFSKDNGASWQSNDILTNNTYIFDNLTTGSYNIKVRVTNNAGIPPKVSEMIVGTTDNMISPTIVVDKLGWAKSKIVTITYPEGFNNYYKINNGAWTRNDSNSIDIPVTVSGTEIFARTYDGVNYSGSETIVVGNIDSKTPEVPTITANDSILSNNWHTNNFILTFSGSSSPSGVTYYYGTNINNMTNTGSTINVTENTAETTYYVKACNAVGTCSTNANYVVKLDKETPSAPTFTSSDSILSNNWHVGSYTLTLSGGNNISGNTYYYGTTTNPTTVGTNINVTTSTTGTTYYAKICSGAGLCSTNSNYISKLETGVPTAPVLTGGSTSYATSRTISVSTASTATSGIAKYQYYISTSSTTQTGGSWVDGNSVTDTTNGISYIYMRAVSNAGKLGTVSAYQVTYIDKNSPIIEPKLLESETITEGDSNVILSTYFNYSQNGAASISNTSCIDTTNNDDNVTNTNTLSVGLHILNCTVTKSTGLSSYSTKIIIVNAKYTGVPSKSYTVGSTVTYGGVDFLVVKDNGDTVTLITKSNVTTSAFGSNNTWSTSTIKNYLNTTWLNSKSAILSDSQKTGLIYDNEAGAYVRLIKTNELSPSIANASNTNFWTMTTSGSNVYYALANASTAYTKYTASANTTGTCYSGSSTDLSSVTSTHTKNTLSSASTSTIAAPTATSGVISTSYVASASGSCNSTYSTSSESYNYDCNCSNYACGCTDYSCDYTEPYIIYEPNPYCGGYDYYYRYIYGPAECAGGVNVPTSSSCANYGCLGSGCTKSGCTTWSTSSVCMGYSTQTSCGSYSNNVVCQGYGCLGSSCTKSTCSKSTCSKSTCSGYNCTRSSCTKTTASSYCDNLVNGSCRHWTSGPACAGYACLGSTCKGSACAGSACAGSACAGSGCTTSGCTKSTLERVCARYEYADRCTNWVSGPGACLGSGCLGSGCLGSGCLAWDTFYSFSCTKWTSDITASTCTSSKCTVTLTRTSTISTSRIVPKTCTTCSSTCTSCETCTGSRSVYTASGSTVNWSRYVVSEQTATMGVRAVITVKKK